MASLDLMYGAGGKAHAPDPAGTFTFVNEDPIASNPKFDVIDGQGVEWKVKLGQESQSETAATRFLWAAGYFVDEDYYVAELTVKGLPTLKRGQEFVSAGGIVHGARLERKRTTVEKLGDWDWFDNPFVGQRELNGLRVMMSLMNNWDLKDVNNAIYVVDGERHYAVSDVGATFGKTGKAGTRSKGDAQGLRRIEVHREGPSGLPSTSCSTAAPSSCRPSRSPITVERTQDGEDHQAHPARRREMAGAAAVDADGPPDPRRLPRRRVWGRRRRDPDEDHPATDCGAQGAVTTEAHGGGAQD